MKSYGFTNPCSSGWIELTPNSSKVSSTNGYKSSAS